MSLLMPLITFGAALFIRNKFTPAAGKVNWVSMTEAEMGSVPMAILASKIESGDKLPDPPSPNLRWKPIRMFISTSVFSSAMGVELNVLTNGLQIGERQPAPTGQGQFPGYLTARQIQHPVPAPEIQAVAPWQWVGTNSFGSSYLTPQELQQMPRLTGAGNFARMGSSYLTEQELAVQPRLSNLSGLARPPRHNRRNHRGDGGDGGDGSWGPDVVTYEPYYPPAIIESELPLTEEEKKKRLGISGFGDVLHAGAVQNAINAMIPVAKANGLIVAKLDLHEIRKGDIVVLRCGCRVVSVEDVALSVASPHYLIVREMGQKSDKPLPQGAFVRGDKLWVPWTKEAVACAFGVRRP